MYLHMTIVTLSHKQRPTISQELLNQASRFNIYHAQVSQGSKAVAL
jgi:hypothetical protein